MLVDMEPPCQEVVTGASSSCPRASVPVNRLLPKGSGPPTCKQFPNVFCCVGVARCRCGACVPRAPGVLENYTKINCSEGTELSRIFFSSVFVPEVPRASGLSENPFKCCSSERTKRSQIFFPDVSRPEMIGLSQNFQKSESSPSVQVHHAGQRRPYRWWKARACISENSAWGKRMQSHDVRLALAVQDEKMQMLHNAMEEGRKIITWDPLLAEKNKLARKERKAAIAIAKQQAELERIEKERMRVKEFCEDMYRREALKCYGYCPGE